MGLAQDAKSFRNATVPDFMVLTAIYHHPFDAGNRCLFMFYLGASVYFIHKIIFSFSEPIFVHVCVK